MIEDEREINTLEKCVAHFGALEAKSVTLTERAKLEWSYHGGYDQNINLTGTCAP